MCGFNGKVHPKKEIQSLSPHTHADGRSGQLPLSSINFWSFTAKLGCRILLKQLKLRLVIKHEKIQHEKAQYSLYSVIQVSEGERPPIKMTNIIYNLL